MRGQSYPRVHTHPKPRPWFERDGDRRLRSDQACIAATFPDLMYHIDEAAGGVSLEGSITLLAECGVPTCIPVRVEFPGDYPTREPRVYDAAGRFPHEANRHFYPDGQCCLWLPPESRWDATDPEGLVRFLEEVAVFLDRQLVYEAEGKGTWPGAQRGHSGDGYVEFVQELLGGDQQLLVVLAPIFAHHSDIGRNSRCPCGSGLKYKKCHLATVQEISRRVGFVTLRKVFQKWLQKAGTDGKIYAI